MAGLSKYRSLAKKEQALVALAVFFDGHDAGRYLANDKERGRALSKAANDLAALELDLRIPLIATLLRENLEEPEHL